MRADVEILTTTGTLFAKGKLNAKKEKKSGLNQKGPPGMG
jgi:hypothetical protein